ncbi:hypothetical protein TNCV_486331 [Trichonephila clavipes]|nr:hypothetical protein TNCV_486331 [Trichonephila clavipes]
MGTHLPSVEEVKAKTSDLLKMVTPNDSHRALSNGKLICNYGLPEVTGLISTNGNRPVNPSLETQSQVTGGRKRAVNWSSNLELTAGYLTPGFIAESG